MYTFTSKFVNIFEKLLVECTERQQLIRTTTGKTLYRILLDCISTNNRKTRIESFQTKNKKIKELIQSKSDVEDIYYYAPVINISNTTLSYKEQQQLSFGLEHSYVDKNKHIRKNLAANFETIADRVTHTLKYENREEFHEFLRAYTDIFTNNVYKTKDFTYYKLKNLINNKEVAIVPGDKDSTVVVMNRTDYINKMQSMIEEGIQKGVYLPTTDTTLTDLKRFKDFLYRNFRNHNKYNKMIPTSNQPARLYGTAKT